MYCSHWSTIFLPIRILPVSDGRVWNKAAGWQAAELVELEELTDEEEADDGEVL